MLLYQVKECLDKTLLEKNILEPQLELQSLPEII
jgi:hypothetical protein